MMTSKEITTHNLNCLSIQRQNRYRKIKGLPLLEEPAMIEVRGSQKPKKAVAPLTYEQERNKLVRKAEKVADAECGPAPKGEAEHSAWTEKWNMMFHMEMNALWEGREG